MTGVQTCALPIYFGGTNGFTVFNPREFNDISTVEPIIAITGFHVFNKEIESGSKILKHNINYTNSIELKHNESTFSFDFAALSYLSPENNQFEFILDGFEKEWKKTNTIQKAYYMNIPPGKYVFRIRACNSYQIWNQGERSISIRIKPPFWFSNLMLIIYFFTIITIGWYIIYKNNRRLEKNNLLKLEKYKTIKELETYESKINFFTNIAHEIRTPLSLIIAPLEKILKTCNISSETRLFLGIIEQNTNRLLELVNQLLDYRKMEEGELYLDIRHQDIIPVVRKAYNLYVHNAELKNVSMTFNTTHDSIMCTFDAEAICKILSNLISNAVKYAQSRISLTVYLKNNQLHLEIEDDGIGIDNKLIDKIFEPFFQIENEVNKTKAGSGLGLAFAQSLAVKHDGLIRVFSKGSRTIFTLILPLSDADSSCIESQNKSNEETENLNFIDSNDTNKPKILIVEDNIELRTFLCQNLNANFISKEAENGEFAIRLLEKESFDVIISDIMMPKMDGIEFCRYVKSNPIYSHLPFIILSAKAEISSKVQGLEIGADVYIEKPFSIDFLSAQIASIIENRNRIREKFINTPLVYLKQSQTEGIESVFIQKLNEAIIENIANKDFNIDSLAKIFLMSRSNFHKKIKTITGMTPNDYINLIRLNKAALILSSKKYKINEVCYMVGFNTPSYFTKCFYDKFGKLPKDYIAKP